MREQWFPEIKKEFIHHSPMHKCFEVACKQDREEIETKRKSDLGLPDNPLDDLLDNL